IGIQVGHSGRKGSTAVHVRHSRGVLQPKHSPTSYHQSRRSMLQRPLEPKQYTALAFGQRLRAAGILPSMGTVGDCYDNSMMESFWATLQLEVLDQQTWKTRDELANAIFEWIECWYNPQRRHSSINMLSPRE